MSLEIRRARPEDWTSIKRLCVETAAGDPLPPEEWDAFAKRWVGPYQALRPDWTYAAVLDGRVVGYLTGCPDSLAFEKEMRRALQPTPDSRHLFGEEFLAKVWTGHPAHVHMNVEAGRRGAGVGAALLERYLKDLAAAGVPSVHVFCGARAFAYWSGKGGFSPLASLEAAPGVPIHVLTRAVRGPGTARERAPS